MGNHFVKERKVKNAELRKVRRTKSQKFRKNREENQIGRSSREQYPYCKVHANSHFGCCKKPVTYSKGVKPAYVPKQLRTTHVTMNKSAKVKHVQCSNKYTVHKARKQVKSESSGKTKMDAANISILELRKRFKFESQAYAIDAFANKDFSLDQQKLKLRVLNALIQDGKQSKEKLTKARAILISNMAWSEKEMIRSSARYGECQRNFNAKKKQNEFNRSSWMKR